MKKAKKVFVGYAHERWHNDLSTCWVKIKHAKEKKQRILRMPLLYKYGGSKKYLHWMFPKKVKLTIEEIR